jgi:uncharacterized protein YjiK
MSLQKSLIVIVCISFIACTGGGKQKIQSEGPTGYNWQQPQKIALGEELDEISGIYFDAPRNAINAVNDEQGLLFSISITDKNQIQRSRFHKGGDYEDLCFVDPYPYALKSNGDIVKIFYPFTDSVRSTESKMKLKGKNDFEAVLYDKPKNRLLIFCKNCVGYQNTPAVFSYDLATDQFDSVPAFNILLDTPVNALLNKNENLQISGAAIHPVTGEWYIIASANHLLLIADQNGKIKTGYPLNKKLFKQPEGICFAPNGDLYISNEAKNGIPNMLKFEIKSQPE